MLACLHWRMDEDAQTFIKSHRAKLEQEKENLEMAAVQSR